MVAIQSLSRRAAALSALNSWPNRPFAYGSADCCRLAAHVARELTGRDYLKGLSWSDEAEALALIRRAGGLAPLVSRQLGRPVPVEELEAGDPVLIKIRELELLGIWLEDRVAVLRPHGLGQIGPRHVAIGWPLCRS